MTPIMRKKQLLHVGCGPKNPELLPQQFRTPQWEEVRFDIDPAVHPDIVGSLTDMSAVPTNSMDAVYSCHNIEHLFLYEIPGAFQEIYRVLRPGGFVYILVPDLQGAAEMTAANRLEETAYQSKAGPIRPIDMIYSYEKNLLTGNVFMLHKCGFTALSLAKHLHEAGFRKGQTWRENMNACALAYKG